MKKVVVLVSLFLIYGQLQADEIKFLKGSWKDALALAQKNKQLIFVDAYAIWCGPCKVMEKKVFTEKNVADFYNKNFVCYKLDVDVETELAQTFAVEAMPTFLYINPEAKVVFKKVGGMDADAFLKVGQDAVKIPAAQEKYDKGDRSKPFIIEYLKMLQENKNEQITKTAKDFFATLQDKELLERDNFDLMNIYTTDPESREFKYFYSNKTQFHNKFGEEAQAIIINVYQTLYTKAIETQDIKYLGQISSLLTNATPIFDKNKAEGITKRTYMDFYKRIKQYGKYMELARTYVDTYAQFDEETLLSTAYDFYTLSDKKEDLELAEKWTRRALQAGESYEVLHFLAELLQKAGKKPEAIKECKKAIQYAKNNQVEDFSKSEELLKTLEQK